MSKYTTLTEGAEFHFLVTVTGKPMNQSPNVALVEQLQRDTDEHIADVGLERATEQIRAAEGCAIQVSIIESLRDGLRPEAGTYKVEPLGETFEAYEQSEMMVELAEAGALGLMIEMGVIG